MMRILYSLVLFLFSITAFSQGKLKIGVITDTHYLSEQLMEESSSLDDYVNASGKDVKAVPEVLDKVFAHYENIKLDVLLVAGDITKDGERQSHLDFAKRLEQFRKTGTRVFVIPGNHDINMPNSVSLTKDGRKKVKNISAEEFAEIYAEDAYKDALSRDTASLSYLAELNTDTWLLALDVAKYDEYKTHSISSGKLKNETEVWMLDCLAKAQKENKIVYAMMHWGVVEHIEMQASVFPDYLVEDWERIANLLADNAVRTVFTGHFHANDITAFESDNGNKIYDIETGTLCTFPYTYRTIDLYDNRMDIETFTVDSIPSNPNLRKDAEARMKQFAFGLAISKMRKMELGLSDDMIAYLADIAAHIFVLHMAGDEEIDEELKEAIESLASMMDSPISADDLELDFVPADNNLTIYFDK